MFRKIKNKSGGAVILISMVAVMVMMLAVVPGIVDTSETHLISKKLKIHLNSVAKSGAIEFVDWNQTDQMYEKRPEEGMTAALNTAMSIFNKDGDNYFTEMSRYSDDEYETFVYKNADSKMAIQIFLFNEGVPGLRPSTLEISDVIYRDSEGHEVPGWKDIITLGQMDMDHPSVVAVMRYETFDKVSGDIKSIIRISTSQNKNI